MQTIEPIPTIWGFMLDIGGPRDIFMALPGDSYSTIILCSSATCSEDQSLKAAEHRRVFIKAGVGLAFGAGGTMSNVCSKVTGHPSLPRGSHLELCFVVSTRSSRISALHFPRRVTHVD